MTEVRIPISRPWFGEEERAAVARSLETGWVAQGPFVREFEEKFARFAGTPFAAATTSCTTAMHLAVAALGLRPGDEVIVPAFTWISTANVIEYMGARPVFCDISLRTFNLDVDCARALVKPRTVGILPVHLFGLCADMEPVLELAARHRLWVVEDAACGLGARLGERHAGTFGDAGCFSFHPRKAITTGEGGMITTANPELDARVRSLRDHGAAQSQLSRHKASGAFLLPDFELLGYNFRMSDIQGAVGSVQMDRAEAFLAARRAQARRYDERLSDVEWLDRPCVAPGFQHAYQAYVCLFRPDAPTPDRVDGLHARRNLLMSRLEERGIATRQGTHAPPFAVYYARKYGFRPCDFPNAYAAERLSLALPIYPGLTDAAIDAVCDALIESIAT